MANGWEGDIDNVDSSQLQTLLDARTPSNALMDKFKRWPNGVMPYTISSSFNNEERAVIAKAVQEYHDKTCIR